MNTSPRPTAPSAPWTLAFIFTERLGQAIFGAHVLAGDLAKGVGWVINLAVAELVIRRSVAGQPSGAKS